MTCHEDYAVDNVKRIKASPLTRRWREAVLSLWAIAGAIAIGAKCGRLLTVCRRFYDDIFFFTGAWRWRNDLLCTYTAIY